MFERFQEITSAQNPRIKQTLKLRQHRGRTKADRIVIDGERELARAIDGGVVIERLFLDRLPDPADPLAPLVDAMFSMHREAELCIVPQELLARLAYGERHDQPVAVAQPPEIALDQLELSDPPLIAILDRVEKPGNLGAIVRSADAAGVDAVIVADAATDLYNPNAIRASLGTIFTTPVCAASLAEVMAWLSERGLVPLVARVDGSVRYHAHDFCQPTAIVLGSEAWGISAAWDEVAHVGVCLPMRGLGDSLNVSATAAILFYEADRQRRSPS